MPGRKYEAQSGYRYGFNGKEKDKDLNSLTVYDYGFRIYNPGIGKFLSVDPLTQEYPELTPFQFASNTPIQAIDLDGLEMHTTTSNGTSIIGTKIDNKPKIKVPNKEVAVYRQLSTVSSCHGPANSEFRVPGYSNPVTFTEWWNKSTLKQAFVAIDEVSDYIPSPKGLAKQGYKRILKVINDKSKSDKDKKVPNPWGKRGGPQHQEKTEEVKKQLDKEGFDKIETEVPVNTTGGNKDKRYVDVQGTNTNTGEVKQVQVGRKNKDGTPVSREKKALDDIENKSDIQQRPEFVPYN